MDELLNQLNKKMKELEKLIERAERDILTAPEGTLRITSNHNTDQYYLKRNSEDTFGTYIKKSDKALIFGLAQKEYAVKIRNQAQKQKDYIQKIIKNYNATEMVKIYQDLSMKRKKITSPYVLADEEFLQQWESASYVKKEIQTEEGNEIITEKGEKVRSKSEKILADKLKLMGVPYHYEKPLYLNGYGYVYPDFTVLNKRNRKEYYWEHLGRMGSEDYSLKNIRKIETMQKNNIFPGDKLILTYETDKHPINVKIVEGLIKRFLQ